MSILTETDLIFFKENGFLVIENIFTQNEISAYRNLFHEQLNDHGFNHDNLLSNNNINNVGVRKKGIAKDIFYSDWKMKIMLNDTIYQTIKDLIVNTFNSNDNLFEHDNGNFEDVLPYIDRVCYRLPDNIQTEYGLKC